jgi:hypothetical protein
VVFDKGPRFRDEEFTGQELEMATALYEDGGGVLTEDGTMTLALGSAYGGSTVVYTGTSLTAHERVIRAWDVPGLRPRRRRVALAPLRGGEQRPSSRRRRDQRQQPPVRCGCRSAASSAHQFPVNVKGCRGSSLCNLGCPNAAKQGTNRVQLPNAERQGVEVVTRAEALSVEERAVVVASLRSRTERRVSLRSGPRRHRVSAGIVVLAGGAVGSPALFAALEAASASRARRRGFHVPSGADPRRGARAPDHNDVGHPKSYYLDRAAEDGFVLETACTSRSSPRRVSSDLGRPTAGSCGRSRASR